MNVDAAVGELAAWHARIVAAHPGEVLTTIPVRRDGEVVGTVPAYLPAWLRSDERERFIDQVQALLAAYATDADAIAKIHATPGVPMRGAI